MFKFLPALILVIVIPIIFFSPVFKLKNIQVNDESNCLDSSKIESQQNIIGQNLIFLDSRKILDYQV